MIRRLFESFKPPPPTKPNPPASEANLTLDELLETLARRGLVLYTDGRRLLFGNPYPVLDDKLVVELQRHRPALLRILPRDRAA